MDVKFIRWGETSYSQKQAYRCWRKNLLKGARRGWMGPYGKLTVLGHVQFMAGNREVTRCFRACATARKALSAHADRNYRKMMVRVMEQVYNVCCLPPGSFVRGPSFTRTWSDETSRMHWERNRARQNAVRDRIGEQMKGLMERG
jgi:hypothetical protein